MSGDALRQQQTSEALHSGRAKIWHNPRCSTSRRALEALERAGLDPEVVLYLATGWPEAELRAVLSAAGLRPSQALRRKEPLAAALGLTAAPGKQVAPSEARILAAMLAHPVLVERPLVRLPAAPDRAAQVLLARPIEQLEQLLA